MAVARPVALDRMIREALARLGTIPALEITLAIDPEPIMVTTPVDRLAELLDRLLASAVAAANRIGQILIAVYPGDDFKSVQIELAHRVPLDAAARQLLEECGGTVSVDTGATVIFFPRSR